MAKLLDIHPSALAELKAAVSWYLEQNETTANKFVAAVDRAIDLILASPRRWPAGELETRKFVLQRFPYAVIYNDKESVVTILAVAHGHRQPGYWKDRL
jgi:plasmid stabilization system protein ParE